MQIKPYQAEAFINNIANNNEIFCCLVYGVESGLVSIRSKKIATKIAPDLSDPFLVVNLNEKQLDEDKGRLADEFAAISMLGGRKVIIVDGGNKITESLKIIFEPAKNQKDFKIVGDNFIVILAGDLDKSSSLRKFAEGSSYIAAIACYEDDAATIATIIRQKFKEQNFTFDNDAVEILLDKFGKNRQIILNEIDKLILFMGEKRHITAGILQENIADVTDISAFQFVEEFANRDVRKSIFCLEKIFAEKTSPITIIRFLTNYFGKLSLVQDNIKNGSSLDLEMKIQNIFFKQQPAFKKHLNIWNQKAIANLLVKLQDLEIKCKNSNSDSELLLSAFVGFVLMKKN
jgi:DNA polymerase-3 subunit delta